MSARYIINISTQGGNNNEKDDCFYTHACRRVLPRCLRFRYCRSRYRTDRDARRRGDSNCRNAVESGEAWYELQNDDTILTVRLPSNPSTGYDWSYEISNDQAIELLTQEYVQDEAAPDAVGVGGTWVASFANFGSAFGEVTISFRYARSWVDNEPAEVRTLQLHIGSQIEVISADPAISE